MIARTERSRHKSAAQANRIQNVRRRAKQAAQEAQAGACAQGDGEGSVEDATSVTETAVC